MTGDIDGTGEGEALDESRKNSSAIIQCVGTKKEPLMSFLEPRPLKSPSTNRNIPNKLLSDDITLPSSYKSSMTGDIDGTGEGEALDESKCRLSFERRLLARFSIAVDERDDEIVDMDE
jgi:hypothetical protein